jgi:phosphonate transport system substrate-binding protein
MFVLGPAALAAESNNLAPNALVFHVGISQFCFRNVNRNDAIAAYRIFLENSGRKFGNVYKAEPRVFEDTSEFEQAIQKTPIQMAVLGAWQFLTMDIHGTMKPFFVAVENGKVGRKYVVLTRRDSGLQTLADLRGKSILELEVASANVGRAWLDTRLLSEKLGTQQTFFKEVTVVAKPTAAVLPIFFGTKPACVVDEPTFEVMKELNPQLGQELQAVEISETFADVLICLREDGWRTAKDKSDTIESMKELHLDPVGQQICTLFKIDRLVAFQDAQLDTVRKLRATYDSLTSGKGPPLSVGLNVPPRNE